jgi:hypothetical protein
MATVGLTADYHNRCYGIGGEDSGEGNLNFLSHFLLATDY